MSNNFNSVKKSLKSAIFNVLNFLICRIRGTSFDKLTTYSMFFRLLAYFANDDLQKTVVWSRAIQYGDVKKISELYNLFGEKINIDACKFQVSGVASPALHLAISQDRFEMVEKLLEFGADANAKNASGTGTLKIFLDRRFNSVQFLGYNRPTEKIIKLLVNKYLNIDTDVRTRENNSLLHMICGFGPKSDEERKEILEIAKKFTKDARDISAKNEYGNTVLHQAVAGGIKELVEYFASYDPSVAKIKNSKGMTPLHMALSFRHLTPDILDSIKILIKFAPETIFTPNAEGETALEMAVNSGKIEILNLLLSAKVNPSLQNEDKQDYANKAFLSLANKADLASMTKAIEIFGKEMINAKDEKGDTALHIIARHYYHPNSPCDREDILKFLIDNGADVTAKNNLHQTYEHSLLESAASDQDLPRIKQLISKKISVSDEALLNAAYNGNQEIIQYLIANEANANARDPNGDTLLHILAGRSLNDFNLKTLKSFENGKTDKAILNKKNQSYVDILILNSITHHNQEMFNLIVKKYQPNFNILDQQGNTLLHIAARHGQIEMIKILKGKVDDPEVLDKFNLSYKEILLIYAIEHKDIKMIEQAIGLGANLNARDTLGRAMLTVASSDHQPSQEVIAFLKQKGAKEDIKETKNLILERNARFRAAIKEGRLDEVKKLVNLVTDLDAKDQEGNTILHLAAKHNNLDIFKIILASRFFNFVTPNKLDVRNASGETILDKIIEVDNLDMAVLWINQGADVNGLNKDNISHLRLAISKGNAKMAKLLASSGADTNIIKVSNTHLKYPKYPLFEAILQKDPEMAQFLIECGADLNAKNSLGSTVLHVAADVGHLEIVKQLIKIKPDLINARHSRGKTALYFAVMRKRLEVVEELIEANADLNIQNDDGNTALHHAVYIKDLEIIKKLIEANADLNIQNDGGKTALHRAVYIKDLEIIKKLIEAGVDLNIQNKEYETALSLAYDNMNSEIIELLLSKGATQENSVFLKAQARIKLYSELKMDKKDVLTDLHRAAHDGNADLVEKLIKDNPKMVSIPNENGNTALHIAASRGHTSVIEKLIEADPEMANIINKGGNTALHVAAFEGREAAVKLLMEKNSKLANIKNNEGNTALHMAAFKGRKETVKLLMEKNLELTNIQNDEGNTALHMAAFKGHFDSVELLTTKNPKLADIQNNEGNTALHSAAFQGHSNVAELLIDKDPKLVNIKNEKGKDALTLATIKGHGQTISTISSKIDVQQNTPNTIIQAKTLISSAGKIIGENVTSLWNGLRKELFNQEKPTQQNSPELVVQKSLTQVENVSPPAISTSTSTSAKNKNSSEKSSQNFSI